MARLPRSLQDLVDILSRLPSIGPRQAMRLAFHLVRQGPQALETLAEHLKATSRIKTCERCFFIHENQETLCDICKDTARNHGIIMVVEKETDLLSLESTKRFTGRYLILGNIPKTGLLHEWQKLRLEHLKTFIKKHCDGKADEIVLAFNPSTTGDFHTSVIQKELAPHTQKITRLGRGLPTGGEIEFADDDTLGSAVERRG